MRLTGTSPPARWKASCATVRECPVPKTCKMPPRFREPKIAATACSMASRWVSSMRVSRVRTAAVYGCRPMTPSCEHSRIALARDHLAQRDRLLGAGRRGKISRLSRVGQIRQEREGGGFDGAGGKSDVVGRQHRARRQARSQGLRDPRVVRTATAQQNFVHRLPRQNMCLEALRDRLDREGRGGSDEVGRRDALLLRGGEDLVHHPGAEFLLTRAPGGRPAKKWAREQAR